MSKTQIITVNTFNHLNKVKYNSVKFFLMPIGDAAFSTTEISTTAVKCAIEKLDKECDGADFIVVDTCMGSGSYVTATVQAFKVVKN